MKDQTVTDYGQDPSWKITTAIILESLNLKTEYTMRI